MEVEAIAQSEEIISREPPLALVKTWVGLINSRESAMVKEHATKMLLSAFGSLPEAVAYCRKHGIRLN